MPLELLILGLWDCYRFIRVSAACAYAYIVGTLTTNRDEVRLAVA